MNINKIVKISQLYDYYFELLSEKQREYIENYYFDDLSLTEISELYGISKQAVSTNIKRTVNDLENFEEKLQLIKKNNDRIFLIKEIKKNNRNKVVDELLEQLLQLEN